MSEFSFGFWAVEKWTSGLTSTRAAAAFLQMVVFAARSFDGEPVVVVKQTNRGGSAQEYFCDAWNLKNSSWFERNRIERCFLHDGQKKEVGELQFGWRDTSLTSQSCWLLPPENLICFVCFRLRNPREGGRYP